MIAVPPVEEGAVQETVEEPLALEVAVTPVGALGGPLGLAGFELADDELVPTPLSAVTVKV